MGLLNGRRAVVTGGGSGIGAETCRRMAAEGAQVAVFDLDGDKAATVAKECDGISYAVDVTDYEALSSAMVDASAKMGGLSLLYNNAGGSTLSPMHDYDIAEWRRIVDLNLTGVFHGFKAGAPLILAAGGGAIVSTASISGTRPAAGEAPYSAAKAAVIALTANAALEYAPTIRVNAVSPGMIRTPLTELLLEERGIGLEDQQRAKTPLDRIGTPGDIADVVVFLCSDLARFVTGQNLVADGGMTLHGSGVDGVLDIVRDLFSAR
ncbi:MAG TPA: SDR family NAD(P)-dependent oxidoreductase [Acidimicrobiia bacterium]|nr:SDR family NAD(P)-dependent oxidoreductase [Acidimicrobiia bacterium]